MARLFGTTAEREVVGGGRLFGSPAQAQDLTTPSGLQATAERAGLGEQAQKILETKGEKPEQIFSGGFIQDTFDTLNLLQHGVTGLIQGKGFAEGVKTRASFTEKGEQGLGDLGIPGTIVGIVLDIAVDPLTYLGGFGILKRAIQFAGKGAKAAGQVISKLPIAEKAGQQLGKMFVYRFGQDAAYKELAERSIKNAGIGVQNVLDLARPITKLDNISQKAIAEARKAGTLDNLPADLLAKAKPAFDELDRLGQEAVKVGLLNAETYAENVGKYIARLYKTKEIPEGIVGKVKGVFEAKPKRIDLQRFKKRTDIPEEVREAMGEILEAGYPTAKALVQLTRSVENAKFFGEEATKWGSDVIEEGLKKLPETKALGSLSGKAVPTPIFDDIQEIIRTKTPTEKVLSSIVQGFKFGKVILNPATHARNVMSNFILNDFEGLSPARLDVYAKAAKQLITKGDLYQEAKKAGLGLDTFASGELRDILSQNLGQQAGKFKTALNKIADVYQKEEEFAKMAQYIFQKSKGLSPEEAYKVAERATFNYSQVTPFIRRVRESIFGLPFITFTYKVTPQVAKTLVTKPTKISKIGKIKEGIENQADLQELTAERETEPSWVRDGFFVKLPMKDKEGRSAYFDLTYILPFGDLLSGQLLKRDVKRETGLKESVPEALLKKSPFLNVIKELAKNQDFFGNRIFRESDDIEDQMGDILRHLVKTYAPPLLADQIPGGYRKGDERRPAQWQQLFGGDTGTEAGRSQRRTTAQELLKLVGLKIQPIDLQTQATFAEQEKEKALRTLLKEAGEISEFTGPFIPKEKKIQRGRLFQENKQDSLNFHIQNFETNKESMQNPNQWSEHIQSILSRNEKLEKPPGFIKGMANKIINGLREFFGKFPITEKIVKTPAERILMREAMENYPFTEQFKKLANKIDIDEEFPVEDVILGLRRGIKPYGGVTEYNNFVLERKLLGAVKRIGLADPRSSILAHELLHGWLETIGMSTPWNEFDKIWEQNKKDNLILRQIDKHLETNPLYKNMHEDAITHERFAYLGEWAKGLKNLPEDLRIYYEKVFNK